MSLTELERKAFDSICTESIFDRAKNSLTLHIRIALQGMTERLEQYKAMVEALRG